MPGDDETERQLIELDRQPRPEPARAAGRRPPTPSRVPETHPPLLGDWFIYLSIVVLVCGVVVITALEMGARLSEPLVRLPALVALGVLVVLAFDALLRVWRSAWAWLPVDRGRGAFRFVWAAVLAATLVLAAAATLLLLLAA